MICKREYMTSLGAVSEKYNLSSRKIGKGTGK
jgi:hypothetical protein